MKKIIFAIPLLGLLASCSMVQLIDSSTDSIYANIDAIEQSTCSIDRNTQTILQANASISVNRAKLEELQKESNAGNE